MVPGVYAERLAVAKRAGVIVMQILRRGGPLPRDLVTRRALENASAIVAATGGSTNAALHIPAIANEAGIRFAVDDVAAVFARTPLIGDLRPGGKYLAKDVHDRGGVSVIIRALIESGHIDGDCLTVTGRNLRDEHGEAPSPDGEIVRAAGDALRPDGGLVVLKGNLAPGGALLKVAGLTARAFEGTARVFDSEDDCAAAVRKRGLRPLPSYTLIPPDQVQDRDRALAAIQASGAAGTTVRSTPLGILPPCSRINSSGSSALGQVPSPAIVTTSSFSAR